MKRIYKKPETTVVAVAPVKLLDPSVLVDPTKPGQDPPFYLNHTTIPSNTEY
jgi:hypothetical protein